MDQGAIAMKEFSVVGLFGGGDLSMCTNQINVYKLLANIYNSHVSSSRRLANQRWLKHIWATANTSTYCSLITEKGYFFWIAQLKNRWLPEFQLPHSSKLQHYWGLAIRLLSVISRMSILLFFYRDSLGIFYSPSRVGHWTTKEKNCTISEESEHSEKKKTANICK